MIDIFLSSSGDLSRTPSPRLDSTPTSSPTSRSLTPLTPVDSHEHICTQPLLFCVNSGRRGDPVAANHPYKTPTPPITSAQDDYLQLLEPMPVAPPEYSTLPPGGCPRFPVYMDNSGPQRLPPLYSPAAYKIGIIGRKQEWLTPYEPLTARLWKTVIMELNLTQLNFYAIPSLLEAKTLQTFHRIRLSCAGMSPENANAANSHSPLALSLTLPVDTLLNGFCTREGIIPSTFGLSVPPPRNLIRSYTLQHARVGLASDYKKRSNVLRIRAESEQFLIDFGDVQDLIDWNMALGVGRDVSLDVQERDMPIYRTVPRRRRNRRRQTTLGVLEMPSRELWNDFGRQRLLLDLKIRGRLGRIRLKLLLGGPHVPLLPQGLLSGVFERVPTDAEPSTGVIGRNPGDIFMERSQRAAIFNVGAPDEVDSDRSALYVAPFDRNTLDLTPFESGIDEDDLATNVDDPEDDDLDEYDPEMREERTSCGWTVNSDDIKWDPLASTLISLQKYYRTCLRCIKPLTSEELWVGKVLVKPTTILPLSFWYLRNVKYGDLDSSQTSLVSMSSSGRRRGLVLRELPHMDLSLPKVPNHFVKEYTVGTHGLVPKYL